MVRTTLLTFFVCLAFSLCFGQDSVKKKPAAKPVVKYPAGQLHNHPSAKSDSAARAARLARKKADSAYYHPTFTDKSLNSQYQYLLTRVYHYQQPLISALWQNASDTLNENRVKLKTAEKKLAVQSKLVDSLQTQLQNNAQAADTSNDINILGFTFAKSTYNLVVWSIVGALVLIMIIVVNRSAAFRREARYRVQLYSELEEEFKTYKTKANDKEKKLARELQTERNKLDELLGRG